MGKDSADLDITPLLKLGAAYMCVQIAQSLQHMLLPIIVKRIDKFFESGTNSMLSDTKAEIEFIHDFSKSTENVVINAILDHVCNLDSPSALRYDGIYSLVNHDAFEISDAIMGKCIRAEYNDNVLSLISFSIFSNERTLSELKLWVENVTTTFKSTRQNELGSQRYYFDHEESTDQELIFKYLPFSTNKCMGNLFGPHIRTLNKRLRRFQHERQWYSAHGIPHTLGILMSGPPGTGKTSVIKAVAAETNRHVFNLRISSDTSISAFKKLWFDPILRVLDGNGTLRNIFIHPSQRIYVLEDVDCLTDIVLNRAFIKPAPEPTSEEEKNKKKMAAYQTKTAPRINLSVLLNLLDGILETPERIVIMTSNYPERLDKALMRPGRMDCHLYLGNCAVETIFEMCEAFYGKQPETLREILAQFDTLFTPAMVQESMLMSENVEEFVRVLEKRVCEREEEKGAEMGREEERGGKLHGKPVRAFAMFD